jgi:hypothetical protein
MLVVLEIVSAKIIVSLSYWSQLRLALEAESPFTPYTTNFCSSAPWAALKPASS